MKVRDPGNKQIDPGESGAAEPHGIGSLRALCSEPDCEGLTQEAQGQCKTGMNCSGGQEPEEISVWKAVKAIEEIPGAWKSTD